RERTFEISLEALFLVSGLIAAWAGTLVAVMHALGILPPRYKRQLAQIQATTASTIASSIKGSIQELASSSQGDTERQAAQLAELVARSVHQGAAAALEPVPAALERAIAPITDRTEKALREG